MFFLRVGLIIAIAANSAIADPAESPRDTGGSSAPADDAKPPKSEHLVFLEFLGKGGLWGAGYEYRHGRWSIGGVGSYYQLSGDRFTNVSPYVGFDPVLGNRWKWFVHAGPQYVHRTTPSPGPEWNGMTSSGFAAEVSTGVDLRLGKLHLRTYALAAYGSHFAPGIGFAAGWNP